MNNKNVKQAQETQEDSKTNKCEGCGKTFPTEELCPMKGSNSFACTECANKMIAEFEAREEAKNKQE